MHMLIGPEVWILSQQSLYVNIAEWRRGAVPLVTTGVAILV